MEERLLPAVPAPTGPPRDHTAGVSMSCLPGLLTGVGCAEVAGSGSAGTGPGAGAAAAGTAVAAAAVAAISCK